MLKLLEDFNSELNEISIIPKYKILENDENKDKLILSKEFEKNFLNRENFIIIKIFYSQLISSYSCKCMHEIYAFQYIRDIPLLIPENKNIIGLNDLLDFHFKLELLNMKQNV